MLNQQFFADMAMSTFFESLSLFWRTSQRRNQVALLALSFAEWHTATRNPGVPINYKDEDGHIPTHLHMNPWNNANNPWKTLKDGHGLISTAFCMGQQAVACEKIIRFKPGHMTG